MEEDCEIPNKQNTYGNRKTVDGKILSFSIERRNKKTTDYVLNNALRLDSVKGIHKVLFVAVLCV